MKAWTAFVRAATAKEHGAALAVFRIALAFGVLLDALHAVRPEVLVLFQPLEDGGLAYGKNVFPLWSLLGGPSAAGVTALAWASIPLSAALLLGFGGRVTAAVLLHVLLAYKGLPADIGGGYDRLISNGLWLLILGNGTATLSLDCRRATGAWTSDRLVHAFPRHLAVLQLTLLYVSTGLWKQGPAWHETYDAVYRTLFMTAYVRGNWWWAAHFAPLLKVATIASKWWEILFFVPFGWHAAREGWLGSRARSWSRFDLRWPFLGFGVVMHGVLLLAVNVGPFSPITWCFYGLWLSPAEWRSIGGRLRSRMIPAARTGGIA